MKRMPAWCQVFVLSAMVSPAIADDAADKEAKALEGTWKVVSLEAEGNRAPAEALEPMRWVIRGKEIIFGDPNVPKEENKSAFRVDASKSPKEIDLTPSGGPHKGQDMRGIYQVEKERLKICLRDFAAADEGRPKKFGGGPGLGLIVLERIKEK